jgi:hypothetical protein
VFVEIMARLRMTNADYVAIAVSPALIMALVGSLVFFLIEVLYVGTYPGRLNYVFALFVFATVLIARIAIEFGSERAAMFSLPLGILVYLALMRFIEHPGPLSWLINLLLLAIVWWCAHKLTWDCTLIDDNEDASGEGLLGRVGFDETDEAPQTSTAAQNELFAEPDGAKPSWWRRLFLEKDGPHTPGLWVLYFSLAALPLFGIGQRWIPPSEVGRRQDAFGLLAVYVAAALSLLVTTSFLGLRRYLRQRRVEMPAPMAATWVSLGAVLILLVMFTAALLPRPNAEYAISQAPWQAAAPGDLESSEVSVGSEGTDDPTANNRVTSQQANAPPGPESGGEQDPAVSSESAGDQQSQRQDGEASPQTGEGSSTGATQKNGESGEDRGDEQSGSQGGNDQSQGTNQSGGAAKESQASDPSGAADEQQQGDPAEGSGTTDARQAETGQGGAADESSSMSQMFEHPQSAPAELLQSLSMSLGNALKWLFYAIIAGVVAYFAWTRREALMRAFAEILQQLRELWARLFGRPAVITGEGEHAAAVAPNRRTFREFTDPFASGRHAKIPAVELVRYTFEAFEAWAGDRGRSRSPDQTPQELVRGALPPQSPMYAQAQQLVQLYNQAAYSSATISREAASGLQRLWQMMRSSSSINEANLSPSPARLSSPQASLQGKGPDA